LATKPKDAEERQNKAIKMETRVAFMIACCMLVVLQDMSIMDVFVLGTRLTQMKCCSR
jgi:hypothetical protein